MKNKIINSLVKSKIASRANEVRKNGCYNTDCDDCILENIICNVEFLGDTPSSDSKILMAGFFIGMKFESELRENG